VRKRRARDAELSRETWRHNDGDDIDDHDDNVDVDVNDENRDSDGD